MIKTYILILLTLLLNSCHAQAPANSKASGGNSVPNVSQQAAQNGIVYFSYDNGLPEKVSIGLGGIAASNQLLGIATKSTGVYLYNFNAAVWINVPTDKQIIEANIGALAIIDSTIFVGTQFKGVFFQQTDKSWVNSSPHLSLHNISADKNQLFAMTYNALLLSSTDGRTWHSQQNGLPKELYTFNVL
jgi:hypothetical protein